MLYIPKCQNFLSAASPKLFVRIFAKERSAHKEEMLQRSDAPRRKDTPRSCVSLKTTRNADAEPRKFETTPAPENYPDSGSGSEPNVLVAPAPVPARAPGKMFMVRRLRFRGCEVVQICDGSGSIKNYPGSITYQNVPAARMAPHTCMRVISTGCPKKMYHI